MITFQEFLKLVEVGNWGGDRRSKNPFSSDVGVVNPARDVTPFPPGPMTVKGKVSSVGRVKKMRPGVIAKQMKKMKKK